MPPHLGLFHPFNPPDPACCLLVAPALKKKFHAFSGNLEEGNLMLSCKTSANCCIANRIFLLASGPISVKKVLAAGDIFPSPSRKSNGHVFLPFQQILSKLIKNVAPPGLNEASAKFLLELSFLFGRLDLASTRPQSRRRAWPDSFIRSKLPDSKPDHSN